MVQGGTLKKGDIILAGAQHGKVKALFDHRGKEKEKVRDNYIIELSKRKEGPVSMEKKWSDNGSLLQTAISHVRYTSLSQLGRIV